MNSLILLVGPLLILLYEKKFLGDGNEKVGSRRKLLVPIFVRMILTFTIIQFMSEDTDLLGKFVVQSIYIIIEIIFYIRVNKSQLSVKEFIEKRGIIRFFAFYLILLIVFTITLYSVVFGIEMESIFKLLFSLWLVFTINLIIVLIQIAYIEKDKKGVSLIKGLISFIKSSYKMHKPDLTFYSAVTLAGTALVLHDRVEMLLFGVIANIYNKCIKSSIFQFIIALVSFYTGNINLIYYCALVILVWNIILLTIMYRKKVVPTSNNSVFLGGTGGHVFRAR